MQRGKLSVMLGHCDKALVDFSALPEGHGAPEKMTRAQKCLDGLAEATEAESEQDYSAAYNALSGVVEYYATSSAPLWLELAQLSYASGQIFDAIADSGRAIKLDSTFLGALQFRGQLFFQLGDVISLDSAVQHFKLALHSDPEHKGLKKQFRQAKDMIKVMKRVESEMAAHDYEEAIESIARGLSLAPGVVAIEKALMSQWCACEVKRSAAAEAKKICTEAVALDEEEEDAMLVAYLAEALILTEEFDEAVRMYTKAHEIDESSKEIKAGLNKAKIALKQSKTKNYYKILGVARNAHDKVIKKAYRKLALEWHPDKHADATEEHQATVRLKFQSIAEAYEVLSSEDLRSRYDRGEEVNGNPESQQSRQHNPFGRGGGGHNFHFNF